MIDQDKNEFKTQMIGLGEIYPKEITKSLLMIYFQALTEYSIEDVKIGITKHLVCQKHGGFFPKPADIIRNIEVDKPSCDLKANSAWLEIIQTMSSKGAYGNLELEDKQAIMAVKMLGSWRDLCHTDLNKLDFKKRQFLENYKDLENTSVENMPKSLPGLIDLDKQRKQNKPGLKQILDNIGKQRQKNIGHE